MQDKPLWYRLLWLIKANIIISCLAVGGGYMIVPLMKKQFIDKANAFDFDELLEMYAIAQSAPGAIAINLSAITGYKIAGFCGAVISCIAAVLPPLIFIAIVASCYKQLVQNYMINAALKGMLAAIAAIMIDVVYDMGKNVSRSKEILNQLTILVIFFAVFVFNINAIFLILFSLAFYAIIFNFKVRQRG
ncbi:MAG: chromate transporter [Acetobacter sp.]|nr:chromate transporter [Acetobacter sp.]